MRQNRGGWKRTMRWIGALAGVMGFVLATDADAVTINVTTPNGQAILTGFRYTIEEDRTFDVIPGCTGITPVPADCPATTSTDTLSLNFHRSHMPLVVTGDATGGTVNVALDATKRYFVSVLPLADGTGAGLFAMGGAPIRVDQATVNVVVDILPMKSAQISILLFNDNNPINNIVDAPPAQERGLCGFEVHLYDAGGTYGASGGRIFADIFGNPVGTTYNADGSVASMGTAILKTDANGVLRIKNLAPAKYTVFALPPMQQPSETECPGVYRTRRQHPRQIRGASGARRRRSKAPGASTPGSSPDEPPFFKEFGPPGHHVVMGFVRKFSDRLRAPGPSKVSGQVVNVHMSRPPSFAFFNGEACRPVLDRSERSRRRRRGRAGRVRRPVQSGRHVRDHRAEGGHAIPTCGVGHAARPGLRALQLRYSGQRRGRSQRCAGVPLVRQVGRQDLLRPERQWLL